MKLMIAEELGSTGALAMFSFHRLSAGNGTKPFKFPPCPGLILPQAPPALPPDETTLTFTAPDVALPGSGFVTVTGIVPAVDAVPEAVSWFDDTKVVAIALPPSETCAPFTNLLPVTLKVKDPVWKLDGATLLNRGTGFSNVTLLDDVALKSATLTAVTVILFEIGSAAGAW
jgi:hypothetical protein